MARTVFPWRDGNRFALFNDGPAFFPRMLERIDGARRSVELELYLMDSGACSQRLTLALCAAAQRGVAVRCLLDGFGCQGLARDERDRLAEAGAEVRWYNPVSLRRGVRNFYRDHRKLLVVDGEVAFVGGTGATDEFWEPDAPRSRWREVMVEIAGPLVGDWLHLFERQWQACLEGFVWRPRAPLRILGLPTPPTGATGLGRVAYADARQHRDILRALVRALLGAKQRVWLATPYFLPTWRVRRALRKAAKRGVDVRLLLSGRHTDNPPVRFAGHRYYPRLLKAGVKIFEYQPRFLHLKMVLVDDWTSVGSCNFDYWNLWFNLDANVETLDPGFTAEVIASFQADFAESREISLESWRQRPLLKRVQQRLWGWLDRLVVNILDRRR